MYYFKTFNNYSEYEAYKNSNDFLVPNLSKVNSDNKTYYTPYENKAGDIVLHNGNRYYTVSPDKLSRVWNPATYTVEGVVVVPNTHTPDRTTRFVSLASMSLDTPDTGSLVSNTTMSWGGYNPVYDIPELQNFTYVRTTQNVVGNTTYGTNWGGFLPSDNFNGNPSVVDPKTKYYYDGVNNTGQTPFIESAYLNDGTPNPNYRDGSLSDFNGADNTSKILLHATAYDANYYPAAETCARYHTENTPNWYLPAAGELGYLPLRFKEINASIVTINGVCGSGTALSIPSSWFWSSSEYSATNACYVSTNSGYVHDHHKNVSSTCVRAFSSALVLLSI